MTELFTMIVLAANIIAASAFAKIVPTSIPDGPTAHERSPNANTFEGRVMARIRVRNGRGAVSRDGESASSYWGAPLF